MGELQMTGVKGNMGRQSLLFRAIMKWYEGSRFLRALILNQEESWCKNSRSLLKVRLSDWNELMTMMRMKVTQGLKEKKWYDVEMLLTSTHLLTKWNQQCLNGQRS